MKSKRVSFWPTNWRGRQRTVFKADMRHNKVLESKSSEAEVNHLAGSAAGHALLVVSWPVGVGGTGTLVASSRWEQTQVTAASIVALTWMSRHCRVEKTCTHGMNMRTHTYMFLHSFRNLLDPKNNNVAKSKSGVFNRGSGTPRGSSELLQGVLQIFVW